jgi:hypothetical protein
MISEISSIVALVSAGVAALSARKSAQDAKAARQHNQLAEQQAETAKAVVTDAQASVALAFTQAAKSLVEEAHTSVPSSVQPRKPPPKSGDPWSRGRAEIAERVSAPEVLRAQTAIAVHRQASSGLIAPDPDAQTNPAAFRERRAGKR